VPVPDTTDTPSVAASISLNAVSILPKLDGRGSERVNVLSCLNCYMTRPATLRVGSKPSRSAGSLNTQFYWRTAEQAITAE
jgi:hypothetical protein